MIVYSPCHSTFAICKLLCLLRLRTAASMLYELSAIRTRPVTMCWTTTNVKFKVVASTCNPSRIVAITTLNTALPSARINPYLLAISAQFSAHCSIGLPSMTVLPSASNLTFSGCEWILPTNLVCDPYAYVIRSQPPNRSQYTVIPSITSQLRGTAAFRRTEQIVGNRVSQLDTSTSHHLSQRNDLGQNV